MTLKAQQAVEKAIGQAIMKHRKAVGMTQAQLAERLDLSNDAVSRLERGNIGLSVVRLLELAEIFGCDAADLLNDGSRRVRDQAGQVLNLLEKLDEGERVGLLRILEQMVAWKTE
ncbi:helix-turn-helix domain-containing protein [Neisseria perflava]|uniref:helix-turn-helix domain-containing protein n=1 Tax=Neisseria perflava TaxID=33053 RepID=UPI0020A1B2D9|nr:helix-turn-helix transcriptional regulator [Neisseria perflava]MCP1660864.1 transcriptional regulator with XRE-family HTH domain [Neisseria perflava]MCP1772493.1 transcriptional regulator with XRE-family HTH domain [Neisseria perflava]